MMNTNNGAGDYSRECKPIFYLNKLPQHYKGSLSHNVAPLRGGTSTFGSHYEETDYGKRYDPRIFAKVEQQRTQDQWIQYAIQQGFTDAKFMPDILKMYENAAELMVHSFNEGGNAPSKKTIMHESEQMPEDHCKVGVNGEASSVHNGDLSGRYMPVINGEPMFDNRKVANSGTASVKSENDSFSTVQNSSVHRAAANNNTSTKHAPNSLFFDYVRAEFEQLSLEKQAVFKKSLMKLIYKNQI